jgi:DNA repair exonuclease SbcCD ATPase subunit
MGQTGSGKSTLIDSIVNYLTGVRLQDNFRYSIVDIVKNKNKNPKEEEN